MRHLARKPHFVGHDDHGHPFPGQFDHDIEHLGNHLRIERTGRLIKEHGDRIHGERASDRDPLLLAARQLSGVLGGVFPQADAVEQFQSAIHRLFARSPQHLDLG